LLLFACISLVANAQWRIGLGGGADWNYRLMDNGYAVVESANAVGGTMNIHTQYNFKSWVGLRLDFLMAQRSYTYSYPNALHQDRYTFHQNYHILPLAASFSCGTQKFRAYVDAGLYAAHWTNGYFDHEQQPESGQASNTALRSYGNKYIFSEGDNRWTGGALLRLGMLAMIREYVFLNLETVYYQDFLSHHNSGSIYVQQPAYHATIALQAGLGYRF